MTNEPNDVPSSAADRVEQRARQTGRGISPLGHKLLEARRTIERSGLALLNEEELERERAERRGGLFYPAKP